MISLYPLWMWLAGNTRLTLPEALQQLCETSLAGMLERWAMLLIINGDENAVDWLKYIEITRVIYGWNNPAILSYIQLIIGRRAHHYRLPCDWNSSWAGSPPAISKLCRLISSNWQDRDLAWPKTTNGSKEGNTRAQQNVLEKNGESHCHKKNTYDSHWISFTLFLTALWLDPLLLPMVGPKRSQTAINIH